MAYRPCILISYAYWNADRSMQYVRERRAEIEHLFIDSGAYSAYTQGWTVTLAEYEDYLKRHADLWDYAVQLDSVGNPSETRANYERHCEHGVTTVPVHQYGASIDDYRFFADSAGYVCSGGLAGNPKNFAYMRWLWPQVEDLDCRTHLLGFAVDRAIKAMRPDSVDASNAELGGLYKRWQHFNGSSITQMTLDELRAGKLPERVRQQVLATHGFTASDDLFAAHFWTQLSNRAYLLYAQHLEREYGIKYYFAVTNTARLRYVLDACAELNRVGLL